jgi:hypothetical protein
MDEKDLNERVEDITTTTFSVAGIPIKEFRRFLEFCEMNAKITKIFYDRVTNKKQIKEDICYAIGLSRLMDMAESDAKTELLYAKILEIQARLDAMEGNEEKKKPKTFGGGHEDESSK